MKISSHPLLREDAFLTKVHPPIYATVHAVMSSKEALKKQRRATGGTNK